MRTYIEFEKPIAELESKVAELRSIAEKDGTNVSIGEEISKLEQKARQLLIETYGQLNPWQKTQVARHADRPHCVDYINGLIEGFTPLAGDRYFAEEPPHKRLMCIEIGMEATRNDRVGAIYRSVDGFVRESFRALFQRLKDEGMDYARYRATLKEQLLLNEEQLHDGAEIVERLYLRWPVLTPAERMWFCNYFDKHSWT